MATNLEVAEELRVVALGIALHHLQKLPSELEGRGLEVDAPGGVGQHEAEVDVDDMPRIIQQQVAVVPVLDLEQVGDEAVPGHALHKRILGVPARLRPLHMPKNNSFLLPLIDLAMLSAHAFWAPLHALVPCTCPNLFT